MWAQPAHPDRGDEAAGGAGMDSAGEQSAPAGPAGTHVRQWESPAGAGAYVMRTWSVASTLWIVCQGASELRVRSRRNRTSGSGGSARSWSARRPGGPARRATESATPECAGAVTIKSSMRRARVGTASAGAKKRWWPASSWRKVLAPLAATSTHPGAERLQRSPGPRTATSTAVWS